MTDILAKICADTARHIAFCKEHRALGEVEKSAKIMAYGAGRPRGFMACLSRHVAQGRHGLICEIKKASPSAGLIRPQFDPRALACAYEEGGASCLSIVTDVASFQGCDDFLIEARAACSLPVLRKDFMIDPYQVFESRAMGADCVLLIMAALDDDLAGEMERISFALDMDVLVEVHSAEEMERALSRMKSRFIGINNRNLKTLLTDLATTEALAKMVPSTRQLVSESGLCTPDDLSRMARAGVVRFLIGESLMKQDDVTAATRTLI